MMAAQNKFNFCCPCPQARAYRTIVVHTQTGAAAAVLLSDIPTVGTPDLLSDIQIIIQRILRPKTRDRGIPLTKPVNKLTAQLSNIFKCFTDNCS